jgi:hypothetical protein
LSRVVRNTRTAYRTNPSEAPSLQIQVGFETWTFTEQKL